MTDDKARYAPVDPVQVGIRGRCPRCGQGRLFAGFLRLQARCGNCGLDFSFADSADGPAVFVMMIVGFIVAGAALLVELAYRPSAWVHVLLWGPLVLALCLGLLRPLKGTLIAMQYVHKAREGQIDRPT